MAGSRPGGRQRVTAHLPDGAFDAFAAGAGTAEGVHALQDMQLALTKTLIGRHSRPAGRPIPLGAAASEGWDLLVELESRHPAETREVLRHPFVQTWADHCGRAVGTGQSERDRAHIAGVAAAVAWWAGADVSLPLPARAGLVHLPGVGALRVQDDGPTAVVSLDGGRPAGGGPIVIRRLTAASLPVALDDLDPYRADEDRPALGRLSAPDWGTWRTALDGAGSELSRLVPAYAATLRAGLRAVVPLRDTVPENGVRDRASRRAFGGVGLGLRRRPEGRVVMDAAAALLCEFQHTKLAALLDAYAFFPAADPAPLSVPWSREPLPAQQVLHGLYAHVALAELWGARSAEIPRPAASEPPEEAAAAFRRYLDWADIAVDVLAAQVQMEPAGVRFTAGLRATVDRLAADGRPGVRRVPAAWTSYRSDAQQDPDPERRPMTAEGSANTYAGQARNVVQVETLYGGVNTGPHLLPVPRQLPRDATHFTDRTEVLNRLHELAATENGIAMISGPAGVGKSALAVHWAHARKEAFPDGQLYVNLCGYDRRAPCGPRTCSTAFCTP